MAAWDVAVLGCAYLTAERELLAAVSGGLPMAERTAAPTGGDATGQDVLLATKLHVPRPPAGLVARPRLAEALADGGAGALVLVSAPAGFGKTAFLADWVRGDSRPAGWLSLDAGDNDPARFWRHVTAALDRECPGIRGRVGPLLGPPPPASFERLVTALINELAGRAGDEEVLLVLDDYHVIEAGAVHASVGFLLEHRPPGLRLALASRSDPPLPLARLRAQGQLTELRSADLRFTVDEAAALLRRAVGAELPGEVVAALAARTEGWAVGLQLAGLSLRGNHDTAGFVAAFSGSHRYVLDYLTEEVLDRQPEEMRAFLLETSVLERLSGDLCDAVSGRAGGQAMLEAVERAGLFLTPLDEVRGWWRYHPLFADLLRGRLYRDQPGGVQALHRAAAAWFDGRGLVHEAIEHALAAGEAAWAAGMIERNFDALLERAEGEMVDRWVAALPTDVVVSRPRLLLAQALWVILGGRLAEAERLLGDAERALEDASGEPGERLDARVSLLANVPAMISLLRAGIARRRRDSEQMDVLTRQAREHLSAEDEALRPMADLYLAVAAQLRGRTAEAERSLAAAVADQHTAGGRYLAVNIACDLGRARQAQADLDGALRAYEQALAIVTEAGAPPPLACLAYLGMADVLYERDLLDAAERHAADGIALCRQLAETPRLASGLARLAWIRQARGDRAGALEAMNEAQQLASRQVAAGLVSPVPAHRARLQLVLGDVAAAADWARQHGVTIGDEPDYRAEPEHLVLARVLLAQGRPEPAADLLERWLAAAVDAGRTASTIRISVLLALALAAAGDQAGALRTLGSALALACPRGYVRVFADEGAPMAALLRQVATAQRAGQAEAASVSADFLARVLAAFGPRPVVSRPAVGARAAVRGLAEPLTERELEVLRLLDAGRSNQFISRDLTVALDTTKKHVSHILAKLGAASRSEAVARARELGLIP
jgi:LuxR family transcriptional regulator, maltose regulon positive regulatory protein